MVAHLHTDPCHVTGAYVSCSGHLYEVLSFKRVSPYLSELWLEDVASFERIALNGTEQRGVELVRAAPDKAPDEIPSDIS
jgi:hypothetical protein